MVTVGVRFTAQCRVTPHIGYVTEELYRTFYSDAAASIATWLEKNAR